MSDSKSQTASSRTSYVVAGTKSWNRRVFNDVISQLPGQWHFVATSDELTVELLQRVEPRYVFFLHWSDIVPANIYEAYECVCFHVGDLPYGRGGSPVQNSIVRGITHTKLTALRMTGELDAGPIYLKRDICLSGTCEAILIESSNLAASMIATIIAEMPAPMPQEGNITVFRRRKPSESEITGSMSLDVLYNFIRMLDADTYPKAFLVHEGFRYEFNRASLYDGRIVADVVITKMGDSES